MPFAHAKPFRSISYAYSSQTAAVAMKAKYDLISCHECWHSCYLLALSVSCMSRLAWRQTFRLLVSSSSRYARQSCLVSAACSIDSTSEGILSSSAAFHTARLRQLPMCGWKGRTQSFSLNPFTPSPTCTSPLCQLGRTCYFITDQAYGDGSVTHVLSLRTTTAGCCLPAFQSRYTSTLHGH